MGLFNWLFGSSRKLTSAVQPAEGCRTESPMANLYDTPPDPQEFKRVLDAMVQAWASGEKYIAESRDIYFRYAVGIMDCLKAVRVQYLTAFENNLVIDSYRTEDGKIVRIGYPERD